MTATARDPIDAKPDDELNQAILDRHVTDALYLCKQILTDHPDDAPTWLQCSRSLLALRRLDEADDALDHTEQHGERTYHLAILDMRGRVAHARGEFAEAEKIFLRANFLSPGSESLVSAAAAAFQGGDVQRAEELARKAVATSYRHNTAPDLELGIILVSQMRYREALDCYLRVLKVDPYHAEATVKAEDLRATLAAMEEDRTGTNQSLPSVL